MYSNSNDPNSVFVKAKVLNVDIKRGVCRCVTDNGHMLTNVRWGYPLGQHKERGDNSHPVPEERVVLVKVAGEHVIFMSTGAPQVLDSTVRASINRGRGASDFHERFNQSNGDDNLRREGSSPSEMVPGDKVFTGDRGGLFGLLRGGTFIAKASALSQIIISKLDDLVRIVSRNYEMFSDAMVHYSVNLRGRPYTYLGYFQTQTSSRQDSPDYYEVFGDVACGDEAKENYLSEGLTLPATDDVVKYQRIAVKELDGTMIGSRWVSTYRLNGKREETSSNEAADVFLKLTSENGHWRIEVESPTGSASIDVLPERILHSVGDHCTIEQTATSVTVNTEVATVNASTSTTVNSPVTTVNASTSTTVNSPVATVNASTSTTVTSPVVTVNASTSVNVTTATATISASGNATLSAGGVATISAPSVVLATPAVTISSGGGPLDPSACTLTRVNITATDSLISGDATCDVKIAGVSLKSHTHTNGNNGNPTGAPIIVP